MSTAALTAGWSLAVGSSANATNAELSNLDAITNPSGTILNATFHVLPGATIGSSTALNLTNYLNDPSFTMSGGPTVNVIIAPEWKNNASGVVSATDNWKGPVPNGPGTWAILGTAVNTAGATVTLDQPVTWGQLTITPSTGGSYTLSGNVTNNVAMTHTGGLAAVITVSSGKNTINAPLSYTNSLNIAVGDVAVAYSNTTALSVSGAVSGTNSLTKDGLGLLALGNSLWLNSGNLLVSAGSLTTAGGIVAADGTITVGGANTAVLTALALKAKKLLLTSGSKVALGTSTGTGSGAGDQSLLDTGLAAMPAALAESPAGGGLAAPAAAVPEPATWALLAVAAFCLPPLIRRNPAATIGFPHQNFQIKSRP